MKGRRRRNGGRRNGVRPRFLTFEALEARRLLSVTDVPLLEDTYVRTGTHDDESFGGDLELATKTSSGDNTRRAFLKLDIGSLATVDTAKLRLFGYLRDTGAPTTTVGVYPVSNDAWDEDTLTWNLQPGHTATQLDQQVIDNYHWADGGGDVAEWYQWDISAHARAEKPAATSSA